MEFIANVLGFMLLFSLSSCEYGCETVIFRMNRSTTITCNISDGETDYVKWLEYGRNAPRFEILVGQKGRDLNVSDGGIYACSNQTETFPITKYRTIFIIAPPQGNNAAKGNSTTIVKEEDQNVTLDCNFNSSSVSFVLFWIVDSPKKQCLSSVEVNTDNHTFEFNTICRPPDDIKQRSYNNNVSQVRHKNQTHHLEITDLKLSDSGRYLCIIQSWIQSKQQWTFASNISLQVNQKNMPNSNTDQNSTVYIAIGVVAGIIIFTGIILLTLYCVKSQGKNIEKHNRQADTIQLPEDECTPYAITTSFDLKEHIGTVYSLVDNPNKIPDTEYSEVDFKQGESVSNTIYSLVN